MVLVSLASVLSGDDGGIAHEVGVCSSLQKIARARASLRNGDGWCDAV